MPMTREQMEKTIRQGGSVMHGGKIIRDLAELPAAAEISAGDKVQLERELALVDSKIDGLTVERRRLVAALAKHEQPAAEKPPAPVNATEKPAEKPQPKK